MFIYLLVHSFMHTLTEHCNAPGSVPVGEDAWPWCVLLVVSFVSCWTTLKKVIRIAV